MPDISEKHKIADPTNVITLANGLSVLRAFLALPIVYCLSLDAIGWTVVLIFLVVITDFLDGICARHAHKVTNLGKILDPTADGIVLLSIVLFMTLDETRNFPTWFLPFYSVRYLMIGFAAIFVMNYSSLTFSSNLLGKWTVCISALAIFFYVIRIEIVGFYILLIATVIGMISWFQYHAFHLSFIRKSG